MKKILSLAIAVASMGAIAGGSKAPGSGSFQDMTNVSANYNYSLRSDGKKGEIAPLGNPVRVAFTKISNNDTVMLLRNDKGVNFRFDLPNYINLGAMKQPVSFDRNDRLNQSGDVIVVEAGMNGTDQELGAKLILRSARSNSYSEDGTQSCTISRTRQRAETYCWSDRYGYHHCETRWVTETYYIPGYREVTTHYSSASSQYTVQLFDRNGTTQMSGQVGYSDSSSYTTSRGPCYAR